MRKHYYLTTIRFIDAELDYFMMVVISFFKARNQILEFKIENTLKVNKKNVELTVIGYVFSLLLLCPIY